MRRLSLWAPYPGFTRQSHFELFSNVGAVCSPNRGFPHPKAAISGDFRPGLDSSIAHSPPWPPALFGLHRPTAGGPKTLKHLQTLLWTSFFYSWNSEVREGKELAKAKRQAGRRDGGDLRNGGALVRCSGGKALRSTLRSLASAHKPHSFLAQNHQSCPVPQPKRCNYNSAWSPQVSNGIVARAG